MWTDTASIVTTASPQALWRLFEDVAGWTRWNAGIERIALNGPFATGSTFDMQPPGMEPFTSTLREVRPDAGFVDETVLEDTRFLVSHELQALPAGGTRVVYAIRVEGPEAATLGPLVTADFPEVLAALKALAERDGARRRRASLTTKGKRQYRCNRADGIIGAWTLPTPSTRTSPAPARCPAPSIATPRPMNA